MTETRKTKRQFVIFMAVAFGVTYVTGLLVWYGSTIPVEMSVFPSAQMFYPAAGVMLAYLLTRWEDRLLPRWFYLCYLLVTLLMLAFSVLAVTMPGQTVTVLEQPVSLWSVLSQYVMLGGSVLCLIPLFLSGKEKRAAYGLGWKRWKASVFCIFVFLVLYFGRAAVTFAVSGNGNMMLDILKSSDAWIYIAMLPLNFILAFAPFLGEEYGWRYYLQPLLQKRFGMRAGVLILGVVWGLWHIFLDFFFYTTPDRGLVMTVSQIITCVGLGCFFAWAYQKTGNIWVPVILHFLNNNLILLIANDYSGGVTENQQVSWSMIPSAILLNGVLFGLFLLSGEFRKKE